MTNADPSSPTPPPDDALVRADQPAPAEEGLPAPDPAAVAPPAAGDPPAPVAAKPPSVPAAANKPEPPKPGQPEVHLHVQAPNATVGKTYHAILTPTLRCANLAPNYREADLKVVCRSVDGFAELGVEAFTQDGQIAVSGVPKRAGEHVFSVSYAILHRKDQIKSGTKKFLLTVNPDPRSLWKDLEPDAALPYAKPHTDHARAVGGVLLLGASRRGRSHAHEAKFRDDDFLFGPAPADGWYYFAVADGAGSAPFSRRGAQLACATACERIIPHLTDTLGPAFLPHVAAYHQAPDDGSSRQIRNALYKSLGGACYTAFRRIEEEAKSRGCPSKEFATTLLFTLCRRFEFGWFVAAFSIGDGGVAVYRKDGGTIALSTPDSGEFAGQTRFLTMADIWADGTGILKRIHFAIVPDLTAVVAMTDGVSDPKFQTDQNFSNHEVWSRFWDELSGSVGLNRDNEQADAELLEWLNFWSVGNHDDRTIALLLP